MVSDNAVIAAVLLNLTPSSSNHGPLALMIGVTVTPPVPMTIGVTVRVMSVLCAIVPLVPVTVTAETPVVAVFDAVNVSVLAPVVEAGLNTAVTPIGNPLAPRVTLPANPLVGLTVIALAAVP